MVAAVRRAQSWWRKHPVWGWGIVAALATALVVGAFVLPAAADQRTMTPSGLGSGGAGSWVTATTTNNWANALDGNDGDTSYASASAGNTAFHVDLDDPSGIAGTIDSVTLYITGRNTTGNETIRVGPSLGGAPAYGANLASFPTAYSGTNGTQSVDLTSLRPGGGAWQPSDFANLSIYAQSRSVGGWAGAVRLTHLYVEVIYTPASPTLTVAPGASRPGAATVGPGTTVPVDQIALSAAADNGDVTVTGVTVRGIDSVASLQTDVIGVKLYTDANNNGQLDGGESQVGTTQTFSSNNSLTPVTFSGLSLTVAQGTTVNLLVVYDIGPTAINGHVVGSRLQQGDITVSAGQVVNTWATTPIDSASKTIDAAGPTVAITSPTANAVLGTQAYSVQGTASDSAGIRANGVEVQILRSGGQYWSGSGWTGTPTWLAATGTTSWSYDWDLYPDQDGEYTYTITARAYDTFDNLGAQASVTNVTVSNLGPSLVSATPVSATAVDLLFDEDLDGTTILPVRFAIDNGMSISGASLDADKRTVHLALSTSLVGGTTYTVSTPGVIADVAGNPDRNNTVTFQLQPALTVAAGTDYPASMIYSTRGDLEAVDHVTFTASNANATIDSIRVRGLDTANTLTTDVQNVRLFVDAGTIGVWEPLVDTTQLGSNATFSGVAGDGSATATFSGLARTVAVGTPLRVWVTYTISNAAIYDHIVGSEIRTGDVAVSSGTVTVSGSPIRSSGATAGQTVYIDGPPSVSITDPAADGAFFTGASKLIQGTAGDGTGSGLSAVTVMIKRSDGRYWDDTTDTWVVGSVWNPATGTTNWSFVWPLDAGQDHSYTYDITARATDVSGSSMTAARTGIVVDNVAPSIASITPPPNGNEVSVVFSERVAGVALGDFAITDSALNPLTVTGATLQADGKTVVLSTVGQAAGESYTVTVAAGNVTDEYTNPNALTSGFFTGFGVVDNQPPTVALTTPVSGANINVTPYSVTGTAGDAGGSGLASVAVRITRSDGRYWNGTGWVVVSAWLPASSSNGYADWSYSWTATSDDRDVTYTVEARATDGANNQTVASATGVGLDNVAPTVVSANAVSATEVHVGLSEPIDPATIDTTDFTIAGSPALSVTAAEPQMPGYHQVILTTSPQTPDTSYTLDVAAAVFTDAAPFSVLNAESSLPFETFGSSGDTTKPSPPSAVNVAMGSDPVIATVSWSGASDNVGVVSYRIYRATTSGGEYGLVGTAVQAVEPITFDDITGIPGQEYYYKVSALDAAGNESAPSSAAGPVTATWIRAPHAAYTAATSYCKMCHMPHEAATEADLLRDTGESPAELGVCYTCHDGSGASTNIKTGAANSFVLASGHALEAAATDPDLTNTCGGCHDPHRDYLTAGMLPATVVNGVTLTADPNAWCLACHNVANAWYGAGYPNAASPTVDATGYPTLGTFPTISGTYVAYTDAAYNAHFSIPASATADPVRAQGDCLYCHTSHRGASAYDGLVALFRPTPKGNPTALADDQANGTYAALCFKCHGSNDYGLATPATNIKQFVTAGGDRSGHRIKTGGGTYDAGTPLPCYECHNPHGSTRENTRLLSDVLGDSLDTATDAGVRQFCFTCHTTAGDDAATPDDVAYGWDAEANTDVGDYVAVTAGSKIAGLARDAAVGGNVLRLPLANGHYRDDTASCYKCHGSNYTAGGSNVHNPSGGVSQGGEACYNCHTQYVVMEDQLGAYKGSQTTYHHVMGNFSQDGDYAPGASGSYPTVGGGMFCVTCHVDHDRFNDTPGFNLRTTAMMPDPLFTPANTDTGLCLSCHQGPSGRNVIDQQATPAVDTAVQKVPPAAYNLSAHQYTVRSEFGSDNTFNANCSKCHNDEQDKEFATSEFKFGVHWSEEQSILSALGGTVVDPLQEQHCYRCHSRTDDWGDAPKLQGVAKKANELDWYGTPTQPMTTPGTEYVWRQFNAADIVSTHPVVASGGDSVECESCHNPHVVTRTANKVTDPMDTYTPMTYAGATDQAVFCLRCHGDNGTATPKSLPTFSVGGLIYRPYSVTMAGGSTVAGANDKAAYKTGGHWNSSVAANSIDVGEEVGCGQCHDNHGSTEVKLLGMYDPATGTNKIGTTTITDNDNTVCYACHTGASTGFAAPVRDATTGYLLDGTWPGSAAYTKAYVADASGNGHQNAVVVTGKNALPDMSYAAGDCKVCHDVHGTANAYDETRLAFTPTSFVLCFDCHDVDGPATSNIKTYYPASVGGTGTGSGHQIKATTGTLPKDSGLPCYDCHNPHGNANAAYGLTVVTETAPGVKAVIGDAANEIKMSAADKATAANVRNFCFACHTTGDNAKGWDGDSLEIVTAGAKVEGIDRTVYDDANGLVLRLPNNVAQHREGGNQSCYQCHGNDYSLSGQNVHNPSGGISTGGQDCYICHSAYQAPMEDDAGTKAGSANGTYYHHVLGGAAGDGDRAFATGAYPPTTGEVFCLSCHVDHNLFNEPGHDVAANLRADLNVTPVSGVATDWSDTSKTGICTACHTTSLIKSGVAEKASDGRTATPVIANAAYDTSAHQYPVTSTFVTGSSTFSAECSKCHNDEQTKDFQAAGNAFGTHWSANQHIISALGGTVGGSLQEKHCYKCHSRTTDDLVGADKPTPGKDWYGVANMPTAGTELVYAQFQLASKHPVVAAGTEPNVDSVECENCHNPHVVTTGTTKVTDPDDTRNPYIYTDVTNQPGFCLKCHDGGVPAYDADMTPYVPYLVRQANSAINNKSDATKTSKGHWTTSGSIAAGERVSCATCHDNHGSNAPKLLGAYDPGTGTNKIGSATITANNNTVCYACHNPATGTTYTREANGYPSYGTWPGETRYSGAGGIHNVAAVKWPGKVGVAGGECINCHDVHGTAYAYDELVGQFDPTNATADNYGLCFTCHDADGPSTRNIKRYYPTGDGGLATGGNFGHVVKTTGGTLTVGQGLPCYDCHNPHGSAIADGLLVMSQNNNVTNAVGDTAGEINLGTAAGNRQFCFLCHSTADATARITDPTDGAGYVNVTGTALVEGLNRAAAIGVNKLRLPAVSGHYEADATSCYGCHGNDYASATSNNVHNPGAGGSSGGSACNTCHGGHATMTTDTTTYHHVLDSATPFRAPNATATYPTSTSALECVSCHADHNYFNTQKGFNLRTDLSTTAVPTNSDFPGGGTYGICVACHSVAQTKNATGQKVGGSTTTPVIGGAVYDVSVHDYLINDQSKIGYGAAASDAFRANCSKCHDDDMDTGSKMSSTYKIGVHKSSENRIAKALGAALAGTSTSSEENLCYRCHTGGTAGADGYGAGTMTAASRGVQAQFGQTYAHNVSSATWVGRHVADEYTAAPASINSGAPGGAGWWGTTNSKLHVECEDCHNPHAASSASMYRFPNGASADTANFNVSTAVRGATAVPISSANKGVWGVTITGSANGLWAGSATPPTYTKVAEAAYEWQLCLKCHSTYAWGTNTPPATDSGQKRPTTVQGATRVAGVLTDVGRDFNPNHLAFHPLFKVGRNQPTVAYTQWTTGALRRTGVTYLSHTFVDGWLSTSLVTCSDCHGNNSWTTSTADGPHGSSNPWILRGVNTGIKVTTATNGVVSPNTGAPAGNFCLNCHRADVYGYGNNAGPATANDLLSRVGHRGGATMRSQCNDGATAGVTNYSPSGCFLCHGGRQDDAVQSLGALHGSSMGRGDGVATAGQDAQNGTLVGNEMGKRFMNGVGWDAHTLGDVSGAMTCNTIDNATDVYSSCTNHSGTAGRTGNPTYYYQWQ